MDIFKNCVQQKHPDLEALKDSIVSNYRSQGFQLKPWKETLTNQSSSMSENLKQGYASLADEVKASDKQFKGWSTSFEQSNLGISKEDLLKRREEVTKDQRLPFQAQVAVYLNPDLSNHDASILTPRYVENFMRNENRRFDDIPEPIKQFANSEEGAGRMKLLRDEYNKKVEDIADQYARVDQPMRGTDFPIQNYENPFFWEDVLQKIGAK